MSAPPSRRVPPPVPPTKPVVKHAVRRYEPFRHVSTGTEGTAVLARVPGAEGFVALHHATVAEDDIERWRAIEATASIYALLSHPSWVPLLDQDLSGGVPVLVFEGVEGRPLTDVCAPGRTEARLVIAIAERLAHGLGAAHRLGLVHGRLCPSAVRVTEAGVPVLDFPWLAVGGATTALDGVCKPPEYGTEALDASSDVYALGMLIALLLVGQRPTESDSLGVLTELVRAMTRVDREARPAAAEVCLALRTLARVYEASDDAERTSHVSVDALAVTAEREEVRMAARRARIAVGNTLGRYRLIDKLGEGGMGEVFRALDLGTGALAAVKVLRLEASADPVQLRRFRKEARILTEVKSPYVARLIEANQDDGIEFMALELIDGTDLQSVLEAAGGTLDEAEALALLADVCRGLAEAHARGIVHRDIKPENVLIAREARDASGAYAPRVKVCDFGIARVLDGSPNTLALTKAGAVLGTPYFMSPEQCTGHPVSPATDVYAMGVTLFLLLSGRMPFAATEPMALLHAHAFTAPATLASVAPDVSEATSALVARALSKRPTDRFSDASVMLEAIERVLRGEPTSIAVHPARPVIRKERVVTHAFSWDLAATPEALWPFVANTDRLNRALGMSPASFTRAAREGAVETSGANRIAGVDMSWREYPFEWVEGRRWGVLRVFDTGVMHWFTVELSLVPLPAGGTRLSFSMTCEPKHWLGRLIVAAEMRFKQRPALEKAFARIDGHATARMQHVLLAPGADAFEPAAPITSAQRRALDEGLRRLRADGVPENVVEALGAYCETAPAQEVARLRPLAFARLQRLDPDAVVEACLRAAHHGLLVLMWDVLCPLCRIPSGFVDSLRALEDHASCAACNADFPLDFAQSLELVFRVSPEVRTSETRTFCIGGPAFSPHVVAQIRLAKGERVVLDLSLGVGAYKLRSPQLPYTVPLDVSATGRVHGGNVKFTTRLPHASERLLLAEGMQSVAIENVLDEEIVVRLERTAEREHALTAARASCLASFRRLFPGEVLASGRLVAVGRTAFLVATVHAQRAMLEALGDTRAFERVLAHLALVEAVVAGEGGAVVKTASGNTLAAFETAAAAARAAMSLRARLDDLVLDGMPTLDVRIAVHQGPTVAATFDGRLDYFGRTVETAIELVGYADASCVLLSSAVADDVHAMSDLSDAGHTISLIEMGAGDGYAAVVHARGALAA